MKLKLTKLTASLLIFLLCVNIHGLLSMFLNVEKATSIEYQDVSFLNFSNGSGSLILKVGKNSGPHTLEPVDCWDSASRDVIGQVVETLFTYNFSNPELPRVNELAESYWWEDITTLQITLRQGIYFHDGSPFNASAAKWSLDRLLYLTNCSGTNTGEVAHTRQLWMFSDGITPIIASVSTVGNWNITINLNGPFAPLLDLLCYINAGMLSPSSTPATEFIDLSTGHLDGTGPFKYDYYTSDTEVKFTRWDNYWKAPAYFEEMLFIIYSDAVTAHNDFLGYKIDINTMASDQDLLLYEADPKLHVERLSTPSLVYQYLGFNNQKYNKTWRKAMSYAINYTYVIDVMRLENAYRAVGAISPGYGAAYNASVAALAPVLNVTKAREIMQSMGFGVGFTTDAEWVAVAEGSSPFLSVPNTYNVGNSFREDMFVALNNWFKQIGIEVVDDGVTWSAFLGYLFDDYDHLGIFMIGWGPDYLEPYNMLDPLFNPISGSNSGQVNDTWLNDKMASALNETDDTTRNNIYKSIQWYMATQGFFHIPLYHAKIAYTHLSEIKGVPYNVMKTFYAYPIYSVAPGPFTLSSDAEDPDPDGNFTLNWTESSGADSYTVYRHSSYITTINGSLTVLANGITETNLTIKNLFFGTHYFIVEALNASGDTLSNCIEITVFFIDPNKRSPIFDGLFLNYSFADVSVISVNYSYISGNNYEVNETVSSLFYGFHNINNQTREMSGGGSRIFPGDYTPYWIFSNQSIGDLIYIAIDGEGDHQFNITGETTINLPGLGDFDVWVLKDLTEPNSNVLYDQATGILLNGTFFFNSGASNYSLTLQATNLIEPPPEPPGEPPKSFLLGSTANSPDIDGNFNLIWTSSEGANNYSIYQHSALITEINGSLTLLSTDYTETTFSCIDYSDGVYYFIIVAHNNFGVNYSNCLRITVLIPPDPPPKSFILGSTANSPDIDGNFDLIWASSEGANNYSIYQHSALITEINGSLTLLSTDYTETTFSCVNYSNGVYYFIVVAHNNFGVSYSNSLRITVLTSPVIPPEIPGYAPLYIIGAIIVSSYVLIRKRKKTT